MLCEASVIILKIIDLVSPLPYLLRNKISVYFESIFKLSLSFIYALISLEAISPNGTNLSLSPLPFTLRIFSLKNIFDNFKFTNSLTRIPVPYKTSIIVLFLCPNT